MGVLDKFLDILKLSDEDEDYDEEFFDDEEYDDIEEKPKRNFFKKEKQMEENEEQYNVPEEKHSQHAKPASSKVTPMRQPARKTTGMEVCVIKPTNVDAVSYTHLDVYKRQVVSIAVMPNQPFLKEYQQKRILAWLEPEKYADDTAYQQQNSIMAIGSGQLKGKGLNNNTTTSVKNGNFLLEADTDFIFAIIGEELGFVGCCIAVSYTHLSFRSACRYIL